MARTADQRTLRELFTEAERLTRELIEHLDKGFIPKVQNLARMVDSSQLDAHGNPIEDITIRNAVALVAETEAYTDQLYRRISSYCEAIDRDVARINAHS